ncbi:MAG: hypothetical protein LPK79_08970, partial [Bacteroidota bacterium]|nr:hypothetical protein [Bacteroidota bacterium]
VPILFYGKSFRVDTINSSIAPYPTVQFLDTTSYSSSNVAGSKWNFDVQGALNVPGTLSIGGELKINGGSVNGPNFSSDFLVRNLVIENGGELINLGLFFYINGKEDTSSVGLRIIGTGNSIVTPNNLFFSYGASSHEIMIDGAGTFTMNVGSIFYSSLGVSISSNSDTLRVLGENSISSGTTLTTNGRLILGSTASSQATLDISAGTINGVVVVERYLQNPGTHTWRHFGFPFSGGDLGSLNGIARVNNPSSAQVNAYSYNSSRINPGVNDTAIGWQGVSDWSTASTDNPYIIWSSTSQENKVTRNPIQISGNLNTSQKTYNLSYSWDPDTSATTNSGRGWNFIPNPFPSNVALDLLIGDASFDPTYKGVHMWNANTQQYTAYTQGGGGSDTGSSTISNAIPVTGGFWVKANTTGQSITLDPNMIRSDLGVSIHRIAGTGDVLRLYLKDNQGRMDVIKIMIDQNGTAGMDLGLDAYKRFSMNKNYPGLFMEHGLDLLTINAIPYFMSNQSIDLGMKKGVATQYSIEALTSEFNPGTQVILEDKTLNIFHNLRTGPYAFTQNTSGLDSRFVLHLNDVSMGMEEWKDEKMFIAGNGSRTEFRFSENETLEWIEVVDITGALLHRFTNVSGGVLDLTEFDSPGIELLRIRTSTGERVLKF